MAISRNEMKNERKFQIQDKLDLNWRGRERERLNDGNNNGQATHGARKHAWRTQAAWANFIFIQSFCISNRLIAHN